VSSALQRTRVARIAWSFLLLASLLLGAPAHAAGSTDDKRACAEASEEAQLRRIHGKLRGAREELLVCARDVCPVLVKHDCEQWLAEVEASLPTVVISALDKNGHDAGDVRVTVDGQPFLEKLDGTAATIDPGQHMMRFNHAGDPPVEQKIIVREGEKNRQVSVQLGTPVVPAPLPNQPLVLVPGGTQGATPGNESPSHAVPILSYSLIGAGAASLGVALYFEIKQLNDYSDLKNGCNVNMTCTQAEKDSISNERIYAGITLGAGIAAAGAGTILLLTRPKHKSGERAGASPSFLVLPSPRGGSASFALSFW
jgi:hypothetical protein